MSPKLPKTSRVLLVEDQPIIAMDLEFMLSESGITLIDTAATAAEALSLLAAAKPDVAALDFNLRSGTSVPVAEALIELNVPFVFTTGYGDNSMIPKKFSHVPVITKPYDAAHLIGALAQALVDNSTSSGSD